MGDNNLELDLNLKLHLEEIDSSEFDGLENAAKSAGKSIEKSINTDNVKKQFTGLENAAASSFKSIVNEAGKSSKTFKALGEGLKVLSTETVAAFGAVAAVLGAAVGAFAIWKKSVEDNLNSLKKLGETLKPVLDIFVKFETSLISGAANIISKVNLITLTFKGLKSILSSVLDDITSSIKQLSFTDAISNMESLGSKIGAVFSDGASKVVNFSNTAISSLGMASTEAADFTTKFGEALKATGESSDNVLKMSTSLTKLTAAMSNYYNVEHSVAADSIFSAVIQGNTDALSRYGIALNDATLSAYASSQGYSVLYKNMSAVQQQAVRYNYILSKTKKAQDALTQGTLTTAGYLRLLKSNIIELGNAFARLISTFINPLLKAFNILIATITRVVNAIAALFGKRFNAGSGSSGIGGQAQEISDAMNDVSDSANDAVTSEDSLGKSIKNTAKEAKKALAPFHKLNVLQQKQSDIADASSGAGDSSGAAGIKIPDYSGIADATTGAFEDMNINIGEELKKLADMINDFFKDLPQKIQSFFDWLQPYIKKAASLLNDFVDTIDTYKIGESLSELFEGIFRSINTFLEELDSINLGKKFGEFLNGIIENEQLFVEFGHAVGNLIKSAFEFILGTIREINWAQIGTDLWLFLESALVKINPEDIKNAIFEGLKGISTALTTFFEDLKSDTGSQKKIADTLGAFITGITDYLGDDAFVQLVESIVAYLSSQFEHFADFLNEHPEIGTNIGHGIATVLNGIGEFLAGEDFAGFIDALVVQITNLLGELAANPDAIVQIGEGIAKIFGAIQDISQSTEWETFKETVFKTVKDILWQLFTDRDIPLPLKLGALEAMTNLGVPEWLITVLQFLMNVQTVFQEIDNFCNEHINPTIQKIGELAGTWIGEKFVNAVNLVVLTVAALKLAWDEVTTFFSETLEAIRSWFEEKWNWIQTNIIDPIKQKVDEIWTKIEEVGRWIQEQVIDPIKTAIGEIGKWIDEHIIQPAQKVKNAFEEMKKTFDTVKETIVGGFKAIGDAIDNAIKKAKEFLDNINPLKNFSLPSFGSSSSRSSSSIRGYANGGVFMPNKPQLAILGDQTRGVNVESPLSTMVEAFRAAASDLAGAGFSGSITIPIYVDGVLTDQKVITASQMHNYRSNGR